ncbi:hypothetical protein LAZ67_14000036, partial [Cordylochernes scorpioides]
MSTHVKSSFITDNTIIVGDLNAKHQLWGCSMPNPRGKILSNLFDDNAFMCLNDGNPTHHSYSYNTAQALDISFSSPDIFHKCKWQILKSIGSDHLPILIEISTKTKTSSIKEKFWNFKKANWNLYQQNTNEDFRKAPTRIKDLEQNWISFKNTIIKAAKVSIPRGNIKKWIPNYTHQAKDIQTLITKRNELQKNYALENTDLNKTPGPDGIHGQMISNLGKNGKEILLDIFNNSWKTGKLPQDWKTATIIPIKKLDKSADDPKNYRPISLTSICCKLMEKIILRRLTYHLDTRNLLPEEQYGFRKGHGTIDQLLFFTQKTSARVPLQGYGGAVSVLMLESAAKASASMLGTASNYRQSQTFTKVCLDHGAMINESCTPIPHSMRSDVDLHTASPVAQNKQGRVQDLGRGFCPISIIQSPQTSHFATSKQLSILQCNINGLCSAATKIKLEEIMEIAEKQKIQIIALQETKLNEKYNLKFKNYNILRKDRNKEGGGLAFLIKNLYYEDIAINIPNTSDLEAQGIKVYLNQNKTINIFNMYHPPNNKLIDDGTMAQFLTDNTIIVGDLNAKHQLWGCSTPNPRGKILSNLFDDNAFMCLNDGNPTHHSYSYNTAQALDISFSSPDIFHKCKWQILKSIGSDHLPILIEISTKTKTSSIKEKFWNFKKANWNLYQQNTNEDFRKAPTRIKDLEQNWISFKNTIIKAAKVSIPRGNIKKWIPNYTHQAKDIQTLITKRNELQKKCTQNQTNCRTELNIVNAKIKRLYVNMKREKWKQTCENLNPRNPNTKLWHLAKQIDRAQPQTENTNMIKNTDGTPATNDKNAANLLGNSYQISSKIKFEIKDKKVEKKARKIIHDCKNVTSTHNIFHEKINMKELDYALENTDLNKTPGPDGIHGQMISNLGKNGKEKLLDIFNNSWKTGKLPQDWKTATIIPIKKLDKSADDPKNYRPISLTSICCKLMEKIILRRLTYHLDTRNLLPKEQYGFRKGHGTIDQLLFFTQKVKDAQNRKPTNHTIAAFLDLTQAFDKVWKNKLITKLYKHFKIDGKAITWINDFLKNRYIRVKYNGTLSKTFKLYHGLPQGSVLSPTLFTLFIAGIEEKISHKTNIGLFADDIILWSSNTNWKKAERDLNKTLFHLEKFANKHKLEFNPQKSETCLFTTDKKLYKIRPKIILKEQHLQYNKHPKYLGYTLDPEINSSNHIEEVIRKGRDRLKILKYISGREWGADATTLKLTYTSLIRPILEYGYQIYGTASETNLKSLERIQLSAARIITGLRNTCPNDIVLYEADIMPLKDRRSYNLPKYINKIKSYGNKHRTSNYILNWESNLRLKKEGPLHLAKRNGFLKYKVEKNYLAEKNSPCKPLQNVIFNATLNEPTNKQYQNPEYLKQLSLEIINNIPKNAITIYTDGSRDELGHTGSGCLIKTTNGIEKMNRRNPDFCSVFRSELIAIYEALKSIRNTNYQNIWILTDSRSAIQHLSHTGELRDKVSRNIIGYLQKLSKTSKIHLQWIPSHVGIEGNEAADVLAKKGTKEPLPQKNKLTFKEIETIAKTKINKNWRIPPKHSWYSGVNPGEALKIKNRQHQTTLTRFRTGHLKPLKIENNNKIYPTCPKCSLVRKDLPASEKGQDPELTPGRTCLVWPGPDLGGGAGRDWSPE